MLKFEVDRACLRREVSSNCCGKVE